MSDKLAIILKDLAKLRFDHKEIKKDLKKEEKIETDEYLELKKALKDLKTQVKDYEDNYKRELCEMEDYQKLREMGVLKEEEVATKREELFKELNRLPKQFAKFEIEINEDIAKVEIQPAMKLYVNGKEEKV